MAICRIVITSYNNAVIYKLNTFIKKAIPCGIAGDKLEKKS